MTPSRRIHLDHNAATPADPRVIERFVEVERDHPANPGSLHTAGRAASAVLEGAREELASMLGYGPEQVLFLSGGTEANNLALLASGDLALPVWCSAAEHPSVFEAAAQRGRVELPVDEFGRVRIECPPERPVGLLAVVHGQNEVGVVQPIERAAAVADELCIPLHVDLAQTLGRIPVGATASAADTVAISPHKLGGLAGVGILAGPGVSRLAGPRSFGGAQEFGLRAGTPSPALAAAAALAVRLALDEQVARAAAMLAARRAFEFGVASVAVSLTARAEAAQGVIPDNACTLPNTAMCRFEGVDGRTLLPALDIAGVEASAGSACSAGSPEPPRVLRAMGLDEDTARQCLRFSCSHRTTVSDAREAAARVVEVVLRLRENSARLPTKNRP